MRSQDFSDIAPPRRHLLREYAALAGTRQHLLAGANVSSTCSPFRPSVCGGSVLQQRWHLLRWVLLHAQLRLRLVLVPHLWVRFLRALRLPKRLRQWGPGRAVRRLPVHALRRGDVGGGQPCFLLPLLARLLRIFSGPHRGLVHRCLPSWAVWFILRSFHQRLRRSLCNGQVWLVAGANGERLQRRLPHRLLLPRGHHERHCQPLPRWKIWDGHGPFRLLLLGPVRSWLLRVVLRPYRQHMHRPLRRGLLWLFHGQHGKHVQWAVRGGLLWVLHGEHGCHLQRALHCGLRLPRRLHPRHAERVRGGHLLLGRRPLLFAVPRGRLWRHRRHGNLCLQRPVPAGKVQRGRRGGLHQLRQWHVWRRPGLVHSSLQRPLPRGQIQRRWRSLLRRVPRGHAQPFCGRQKCVRVQPLRRGVLQRQWRARVRHVSRGVFLWGWRPRALPLQRKHIFQRDGRKVKRGMRPMPRWLHPLGGRLGVRHHARLRGGLLPSHRGAAHLQVLRAGLLCPRVRLAELHRLPGGRLLPRQRLLVLFVPAGLLLPPRR